MRRILILNCLAPLVFLLSNQVQAQQAASPPATRPLVVSAAVGEVIDAQEKATYGLFPYYSADNFAQARFEQNLSSDSTIQLRALLRDGRTVLRPFSAAEFAAVRTSIETRQREVSGLPSVHSRKPLFATSGRQLKIDRRYRVGLRSGITLEGYLVDQRRTQLDFLTADSVVVVERSAIVLLEEISSQLYRRPTDRFAIGSGDRLFLSPTARSLSRHEGYIQSIVPCVLGGGYGITNNFSVSLIFSAIPLLPLSSQFLVFTPKVSVQMSEKWRVGGSLMYVRVPDFGSESVAYGLGIAYGVATYGSADNNFTVGAGYGFAGTHGTNFFAGHFGGQKRISRRLSLVSENYLLTHDSPGLLGLYGARFAWRRNSVSLGALYALPFLEREYAFNTVIPLYYEYSYRFGKRKR
ncbi:hypothetical protein [Hymenobacter sp.]|jgi:hypothetical protein|uniref:hypothetical protein n=1 Tax=Hymenobacter sp. TaxID=1898978 RepID=UPI002ED9B273